MRLTSRSLNLNRIKATRSRRRAGTANRNSRRHAGQPTELDQSLERARHGGRAGRGVNLSQINGVCQKAKRQRGKEVERRWRESRICDREPGST